MKEEKRRVDKIMEERNTLSQNKERIRWRYKHYLNRKSWTLRTKEGYYYGNIRHTKRYKGDKQLACVKFYGNKTVSFVPFEELEFLI